MYSSIRLWPPAIVTFILIKDIGHQWCNGYIISVIASSVVDIGTGSGIARSNQRLTLLLRKGQVQASHDQTKD